MRKLKSIHYIRFHTLRWLVGIIVPVIVILAGGASSLAQTSTRIDPVTLLRLEHDGVVSGAVQHDAVLFSWSHDGMLHQWNTTTGEADLTLTVEGWITDVALNFDGTGALLINNTPLDCVADCAYRALVWRDFNTAPTSLPHPARITTAAWSPGQSQIATAAQDGIIRLWDVAERTVALDMRHDAAALGVAWHGDQVLSWSSDGTARVWDAASGAEILRLVHAGWVTGAVWNADATHILTRSRDHTTRLWSAATGAELAVFQHDGWITSAQWNADESRIMTTATDGTLRVWEDGAVVQLLVHPGPVFGATWNADESQILAWSMARNGWVVLWDAESGELLANLHHPALVRGALWRAGRVVTWADDGLLRVWHLPGPNDCIITSPFDNVNRRAGPSTRDAVMGQISTRDALLAVGQAVDAEEFVWWQLVDGSWVRGDVVETQGACEALPEVTEW